MNWRVALIAVAAVAAVALLVWLLQGGTPRAVQQEVVSVQDIPTPTPAPEQRIILLFTGADGMLHPELRSVPLPKRGAPTHPNRDARAACRTRLLAPASPGGPYKASLKAVFVDQNGNAFVDLTAPAGAARRIEHRADPGLRRGQFDHPQLPGSLGRPDPLRRTRGHDPHRPPRPVETVGPQQALHRSIMSQIGIFDSGVGGLTVLKALRERMPSEHYLYLGDTARLPYGTKTAATVRRYALNAAGRLVDHGVKLLVVACNTASSYALEVPHRVLTGSRGRGRAARGARAALVTGAARIGVIGTEGTIRSAAYQEALAGLGAAVEVRAAACPLFVPLAEEGWGDHPVTDQIARHYLTPLLEWGAETLILGCTHYPLLRPSLERVVGPRGTPRRLGECGCRRRHRRSRRAHRHLGRRHR